MTELRNWRGGGGGGEHALLPRFLVFARLVVREPVQQRRLEPFLWDSSAIGVPRTTVLKHR